MELTLEQKHENKLRFLASGVPLSMANIIRRYGMMHTPVLAIEGVTFYENSSAMFDEYLAHRMGLIPIVTPEKLPENAEVSFRLDEAGPKKVYAESLKSSDKEIIAARPKIPIITLAEGQHLRLEATARPGYGTQHAKFQAGLISYNETDKGVRFVVESFYQFPPNEVVERGCSVLASDIHEFSKALKKAAGKSKK